MIEHLVHRNHRRALPKSLWLLVFAAAIYVLQNVPILDAVLMILMAMFWPIVTVNMAFVGIVIEAMAGKVHKAWIALPIVYFGGSIVIAAASHLEFARLEEQVREYNAGKSVALSAGDQLLIELTADTNPIPHWLVSQYDIAVVYSRVSGNQDEAATATRLGTGELCRELQNTPPRARPEDVGVTSVYEAQPFGPGKKRGNNFVPDMCIYDRPEALRPSIVTVRFGKKKEQGSFLLPSTTQSIFITSGTGETIELISAKALPLNWVPLPIFGCMRGPGDPTRYCWADSLRFMHSTAQGTDGEPMHLIAATLGLRRAPASARHDQILQRQFQGEAVEPADESLSEKPRSLVLPELRRRLIQ